MTNLKADDFVLDKTKSPKLKDIKNVENENSRSDTKKNAERNINCVRDNSTTYMKAHFTTTRQSIDHVQQDCEKLKKPMIDVLKNLSDIYGIFQEKIVENDPYSIIQYFKKTREAMNSQKNTINVDKNYQNFVSLSCNEIKDDVKKIYCRSSTFSVLNFLNNNQLETNILEHRNEDEKRNSKCFDSKSDQKVVQPIMMNKKILNSIDTNIQNKNMNKETAINNNIQNKLDNNKIILEKKEILNKIIEKNSKEVAKEASKKATKEIPKEIPIKATKEISKETFKEILNEKPKEMSKKIPKKAEKEISKKISKDNSKEMAKETFRKLSTKASKDKLEKEDVKSIKKKPNNVVTKFSKNEVLPKITNDDLLSEKKEKVKSEKEKQDKHSLIRKEVIRNDEEQLFSDISTNFNVNLNKNVVKKEKSFKDEKMVKSYNITEPEHDQLAKMFVNIGSSIRLTNEMTYKILRIMIEKKYVTEEEFSKYFEKLLYNQNKSSFTVSFFTSLLKSKCKYFKENLSESKQGHSL